MFEALTRAVANCARAFRAWLETFASSLQRALGGLPWRKESSDRLRYSFKRVADRDQEELRPWVIQIEHRGGKDRWLHLLCPCGCGSVISLNLMQSSKPFWTITFKDRRITVTPSVDKRTGCRSHFFIEDGALVWARSLHQSLPRNG